MEVSFLGKFGPKSQNCSFEMKFLIETDLDMQNSIVMVPFFALDEKYTFWANVLQTIKIAIFQGEILYLD